MLLKRIVVATVGVLAVIVPLAVPDYWGWSAADFLFLAWLMTPFLLLIAMLGGLAVWEQVVLTAGLAIATAAFEIAVTRSDDSTAPIALLFLPLYLLVGMVVVVLLGRFLRALR